MSRDSDRERIASLKVATMGVPAFGARPLLLCLSTICNSEPYWRHGDINVSTDVFEGGRIREAVSRGLRLCVDPEARTAAFDKAAVRAVMLWT
jgi:hypothetical protein